jgi:amino-acid N-acetyltransferase
MSPHRPEITIRPATGEDLPDVVALVTGAGLPAEGVDASLVAGMCVAQAGEALVGCAAIEWFPRSGLLRSVAVGAGSRGAGVGARLVRDRLSWAASQGLESVYLLTTTAPGFFERFGFRPVPREDAPQEVRSSREYSTICPETAVLMALDTRARGATDALRFRSAGRSNAGAVR